MTGLLFEPTPSDERAGETDTAARCDDPTPRGVIRAALAPPMERLMSAMFVSRALAWVLFDPKPEPLRVLDVGAGYGAWSSELRRLANRQGWPVHITGVELHAAREKHGRKWCDAWLACDWREAMRRVFFTEDGEVDLVIGNPPFDELTGPKGAKRPPELCMPAVLLRHAPAVLLLHTQQAFLKSEAGRASWRHNPPAASWLVPGGVKFRGPHAINPKNGKKYGADSDCYQVTLWLRGHTGSCSTYMLPDLPPSARAWTVPPGTEEPSKCETCHGTRVLHKSDIGKWPEGERVPFPACCYTCKGSGLDPNGDLPSAPGWTP